MRTASAAVGLAGLLLLPFLLYLGAALLFFVAVFALPISLAASALAASA